MTWDDLCDRYSSAVGTPEFEAIARRLEPDVVQALTDAGQKEVEWLIQVLGDERRKWFGAFVAGIAPQVPEALFLQLIRAAVAERDPSFNRYFVEPCIGAFGHRRVNEALLALVKDGSNFEKAGAVNALYWAQVPLEFEGSENLRNGIATPESQAAHDALNDLWVEKRRLFLQEFVTNSDLHVRRSIVAMLNVDPRAYPAALEPLVDRAIRIARTHPDDYIRQRIEVQLGTERLLKPLPHRD